MAQVLDIKLQEKLNNFFTAEVTPKHFSQVMHEFIHEVITLHLSCDENSRYNMPTDTLAYGYYFITKLIEMTNDEIPYTKPMSELAQP